MTGEHLDLTSGDDALQNGAGEGGRPFVGVHFACCDVYVRVYINKAGTGYSGYCPHCLHRVHLKIGPGGTQSRFFTAS